MRRALVFLLPLFLLLAACSHEPPVKIAVTMKKYAIEPAEIRVKRGQKVELTVSTLDVQHGFSIPDLGIKEPVQKGRPAVITFTADRAGEFPVQCAIICGSGHDDMRARLIVE
jgi:cytochrome c oxidase subunit 2